MRQLQDFVARSFDSRDEERIRPILEFLNTFRMSGFFCETAERAEVESVSQKVRRMIDEKEVFIGFFTRRHPVMSYTSRVKDALRILAGRVRPALWSAPAWVLQESGYALHGKKDLILLREPNVEVFGLQGDLEYIPFDPENPSAVFSKLSEMINALLAKAAGASVRVTLEQGTESSQAAVETAAIENPPETAKTDAQEPDMTELLIEMWEGSRMHDFCRMDEAYRVGTDLISGDGTTGMDRLTWDCLYFEGRFSAGAADALDQLKRLRAEHPDRPEPVRGMARCYDASKEFRTSSQLFVEAANLQEGDDKARSLLKAADALREIGDYEQATQAIAAVLLIATADVRDEATSMSYRILKESGHQYLAFAAAESALHENPQLPVRFALALDYRNKDVNELALYHFKFLHEQHDQDTPALHNLALLSSECKLPLAAVDRYKTCFALGETLSAANLGFLYLDCGMADEAKLLINQAMKIENHNSRVEKCLAEIIVRREQESGSEANLLKQAANTRTFLVSMGQALTAATPPIAGRWRFSFGQMPLSVVGDAVRGTADIEKKESGFAAILSLPGTSQTVKTDRYTFEGKLRGAVCDFTITIVEQHQTAAAILAAMPNRKSGFIVFHASGKLASCVELSDDKLSKPESLSKVE